MRDTIRTYKDIMSEDAMELGDLLVSLPVLKKLMITERVTAYNAGDMDKVACIDEHTEKCGN